MSVSTAREKCSSTLSLKAVGTVKASKFKPTGTATPSMRQDGVRRPALQSFATPGFQSNATKNKARSDVVCVSSDSTSPTSSLKRDSSDLSLIGETVPHISKRQKKVPFEEKENIFTTSNKVNRVTREHFAPQNTDREVSGNKKSSDLSSDLVSLSSEALQRLKLFALSERIRIGDECLAYHQSGDMTKDIVLLEAQRDLVLERLAAIETRTKDLRISREINVQSPTLSSPLPTHQSAKQAICSSSEANRGGSVVAANGSASKLASLAASPTDGPMSDDAYWGGLDDMTLEEQMPASSSTVTPSMDMNTPSTPIPDGLTVSPYYAEVMQKLKGVFKLPSFRKNQLEAVIATLEGRDVFVLMPTGGGKSLCYQLPAICNTGKTQGVTIVISPLIALMRDQVQSLQNKCIAALLSNSETGSEDWKNLIVSDHKPSLWYITPEKLRDSPKVTSILDRLYQQKQLARFVVDEAHCISTWGQDFRDAYTELGALRERYESVPIMALTATANKRTRADIVSQLKLRPDHAYFFQSFNRTNLRYMVRRKKGNIVNEIATMLNAEYRGKSGIIYCHSRKSCESVAQSLRDKGMTASHFHALMSPAEKEQAARDWQAGRVPVLAATIAFGMGIDKPDVRYVIHYDMPKTLSGYYQETGRAGRDGKPADCIMFFSVKDMASLIHQIRNDESSQESKERQILAVREVYQYCDNTSECRRVQILQHFDERFDKEDCAKGCDTCKEDRETVSTDVTARALTALRLIQTINQERREKVTKNQLTAIVRGSNSSDIRTKGHETLPGYGSCKDLDRDLLELMFNRLEFLEVLASVSEKNMRNFHNTYIVLGPQARMFMQRREPFFVDWHPKDKGSKQRKKTANTGESISAPPRLKKGKQKAVVEEDPIDFFDDLYDMDDAPEASLAESTFSRPLETRTISAPCISASTSGNNTHSSSTATSGRDVEENGDSAETLYKKMLALRNEIKVKEGFDDESDVFDDSVLQYLSLLCPTDYNSFKRELTNSLDADVPDLEELVNLKWDQYGQRFLQLCIGQKTVNLRSKPSERYDKSKPSGQVFSPAVLHSKFDYQPPATTSKTTRTPSATSRPKFKPS